MEKFILSQQKQDWELTVAQIMNSFLSLAIPQFGLLFHISSLRLLSGHLGPVLILSNTAHASPFSPHLLVGDARVWAAGSCP